jgi:phage recombination protein Bet
MSNAIQTVSSQSGLLTPEQITTLAQAGVIPFDTPPAIVEVFATACRQHGLSPFKKEIYLVKYSTSQGPQYHNIVGIDGLRIKACRTGQHAGIDDPKYNVQATGGFDTAAMVKASGKLPVSCTVTVYRIVSGTRCPFTATVIFDEYYPAVAAAAAGGKQAFSKAATMPFNMIAKCAEAKALKMAFSDELTGLHIEEEAAAFEDTTISAAEIKPTVGVDVDWLKDQIKKCDTVEALAALYKSGETVTATGKRGTSIYSDYAELFTDRKYEIDPESMHAKTETK